MGRDNLEIMQRAKLRDDNGEFLKSETYVSIDYRLFLCRALWKWCRQEQRWDQAKELLQKFQKAVGGKHGVESKFFIR